MSDKIYGVNHVSVEPLYVALLQIDTDPLSEYCAVLDRNNFDLLGGSTRPSTGICKFILPVDYASSDELVVGIFDVDRVYNAKFADGVRCELVDLNAVNMNQ